MGRGNERNLKRIIIRKEVRFMTQGEKIHKIEGGVVKYGVDKEGFLGVVYVSKT